MTRKHGSTIRKYEPDFEPLLFAEIAQQKYIDAHQALMEYIKILKSFILLKLI